MVLELDCTDNMSSSELAQLIVISPSVWLVGMTVADKVPLMAGGVIGGGEVSLLYNDVSGWDVFFSRGIRGALTGY